MHPVWYRWVTLRSSENSLAVKSQRFRWETAAGWQPKLVLEGSICFTDDMPKDGTIRLPSPYEAGQLIGLTLLLVASENFRQGPFSRFTQQTDRIQKTRLAAIVWAD